MKLRGSTLVESLIALVIIITVVIISLNVLVSNSRFSSRNLLLKSSIISDVIIQKCKDERMFESEEFTFNELRIKKSISFVGKYNGVLKIKVLSFVNERQIYEKEEFVYTK